MDKQNSASVHISERRMGTRNRSQKVYPRQNQKRLGGSGRGMR